MPEVTSRWHAVPSQKPLRARKSAFEVACGALAPSIEIVSGPQVVVSVIVQVLPWARVFGGGAAQDFGVAGAVTVGAGPGFAALGAPGCAAAAAVGVAPSAAGAASSADVPRRAATPMATASTATTVPP